MSMYETTYYILFKTIIEAVIKIKKLEINEAVKLLEDGVERAERYIISSDEEI